MATMLYMYFKRLPCAGQKRDVNIVEKMPELTKNNLRGLSTGSAAFIRLNSCYSCGLSA